MLRRTLTAAVERARPVGASDWLAFGGEGVGPAAAYSLGTTLAIDYALNEIVTRLEQASA